MYILDDYANGDDSGKFDDWSRRRGDLLQFIEVTGRIGSSAKWSFSYNIFFYNISEITTVYNI
ncbi:hypothetical protein [Paenibacillus ginsengarvi]|uniref:Uncharacterized protein n=1 Tax=Paenibacillus ginsengarvi TaxID=400777 RepID=A0A3B0AWW4_9BACL|nr:hypothetical protein [Paenibacillus ginsengarvi]RKN64601.1 hypothetical protein D7M11_33695 [Paenibacillus ginsengarvi]